LPWRETFIDPSMWYDGDETIFLVEEPGVPNYTRQATIAQSESFIQGFKRYFDLVWGYERVLRRR